MAIEVLQLQYGEFSEIESPQQVEKIAQREAGSFTDGDGARKATRGKNKRPATAVGSGRVLIMHQQQRAAMLSWTQKGAQNGGSLSVGELLGQSFDPEKSE